MSTTDTHEVKGRIETGHKVSRGFVWSRNNELFTTEEFYESMEAAQTAGDESCTAGEKFFVGEAFSYAASCYFSVLRLLAGMREEAEESVPAELNAVNEWLDSVDPKCCAALAKAVGNAIDSWAGGEGHVPSFYSVEDLQEFSARMQGEN